MSQLEIDTFLVEGRLESLKEIIAPCRVVDAESCTDESWRELLKETNPQILVAGWKTKPLTLSIKREIAPALDYVCYMPGSVRKLIPRKLIEEGLLVTNWSSSISRTVAECALLLTLACMRRVAHWSHQMHDRGGWKNGSTVTQSLFDRRIGIHGFGAVAKALLPLLRPFSNKISAFSEAVPGKVFDTYGVRQAESLEKLFSENEVIIEAEALTPERVRIVGAELLGRIPKGGTFVNVARGALVDEDALVEIARRGDIQVGLDVYTVEPLPEDHPFRGCRNIVLLPHLGGPSTDRRRDAADHSLENLRLFKNKLPVLEPVTLEVYDRST